MKMDKLRSRTYCRPFVTRANTRFAPTVCLLFFSLLLTPCSLVFASEAEDALAGMQRRYASVQTISGSFRLSYTDTYVEQVESGEFWLKKPAFMRWEYRDPEEKLLVADGSKMFFYVPLDRQVTVQSFTAEELMSTPLKFLLGGQDMEEDFLIEPVYEFGDKSGGTRIVRLIPRNEAEYSFLILEIDGTSFDLRRLTIREHSGNNLEYFFTDLTTNVKISDKKFRFEIPDDAEVDRRENFD